MSELTESLDVYSAVINKKSSSSFSRDRIFGDKPADCEAVFCLQFSEMSLQSSCCRCRLSSSFDFLLMKFRVFVSSSVFSYLFSGMVATAAM